MERLARMLEEHYAALNRGDLEGAVKDFDDNIMIEVDRTRLAGSRRSPDSEIDRFLRATSRSGSGAANAAGKPFAEGYYRQVLDGIGMD